MEKSTECPTGSYGPGCTKTCNINCKGPDNFCDHINGTCTNGCEDGYRGQMCDSGTFAVSTFALRTL